MIGNPCKWFTLTDSIRGGLRTRCGVTDWCPRRTRTRHASSKFGRFKVEMEIIMRDSKEIDRRVAAGVPVNGDMINPCYFFDVIRKGLECPATSKEWETVCSDLRRYKRRIALGHWISWNWKGFIVLERNFETKLAVVIDVL